MYPDLSLVLHHFYFSRITNQTYTSSHLTSKKFLKSLSKKSHKFILQQIKNFNCLKKNKKTKKQPQCRVYIYAAEIQLEKREEWGVQLSILLKKNLLLIKYKFPPIFNGFFNLGVSCEKMPLPEFSILKTQNCLGNIWVYSH